MTNPRLASARNGEPTAIYGTRHLHSRVAPGEEGARFARRCVDRTYHLVLIIGPGLGHCYSSFRRLLPEARLIGLSLSGALCAAQVTRPDGSWNHDGGEPLDDFLTRELCDLDASSVLVVEWPPVVAAFQDAALTVRTVVSSHLRRGYASLVTQGATGRRWLRNQVFNFCNARPVTLSRSGSPVCAAVLVGSGPTAEWILPRLHAIRERLELWVTSSALDATIRHGLRPDVVVVTDAAVYAGEHLRPVVRGLLRDTPVAAPLSATRAISGCTQVALINEGDTVDQELFSRARIRAPLILPHGTVSATAAALIRSTGRLPIVCTGIDFAFRGERSHARPHLSELYRRTGANRLLPEATQVYELIRAHDRLDENWTSSPSLLAYADWFRSVGSPRFKPIHSLAPSPAFDPDLHLDLERLESLEPQYSRIAAARSPSAQQTRERIVLQTLGALLETVREAAPPDRPRDLESSSPVFATLATRLALPELLRWYRGDAASDRVCWDEVRMTVERELRSIREGLR